MKVLEYCATCSRLFEFDVESKEDVKPDSLCPVCKKPIFPNEKQCDIKDKELG